MDTLSNRIVIQQVLEKDDKQVKFYTRLPSFVTGFMKTDHNVTFCISGNTVLKH